MVDFELADDELFEEQCELCEEFQRDGWVNVPMPTPEFSIATVGDPEIIGGAPGAIMDGEWAKVNADALTYPLNQFYCDLYGMTKAGGATVVVNHPGADKGSHYVLARDYLYLERDVVQQESFIYLGKFWQPESGYISTRTQFQDTIEAFCVDIDRTPGYHIMGGQLAVDLAAIFAAHPEVRPQYVTLTGTGAQLWYMFGKGIRLYSDRVPRRRKYAALLHELYAWWDAHLYRNRGKIDMTCASLNHAFRAPGSPSKHGYGTMLLRDGSRRFEPTDPLKLAGFLGYEGLDPWDARSELDDEAREQIAAAKAERGSRPATERQLERIDRMHEDGALSDDEFGGAGELTVAAADALIKRGAERYEQWSRSASGDGTIAINGGIEVRAKPRHRKLYEHVLARIGTETPVGTRYYALTVLAGYAYNCGVTKAQLERDMHALMESPVGLKRSKRDGKGITEQDVQAALKSYAPLGALRHRDKAEELLGWKFGAPAKRNRRTREEHLADVHQSRSFMTQMKLVRYLQKNPKASQTKAEKDLGITRKTLRKYWVEACRIAQVEDTRSGNHDPRREDG